MATLKKETIPPCTPQMCQPAPLEPPSDISQVTTLMNMHVLAEEEVAASSTKVKRFHEM